jgi:rare lipoprotein A
MMKFSRVQRFAGLWTSWAGVASTMILPLAAQSFGMAQVEPPGAANERTTQDAATPDRSGHKRVGMASFYADEFAGRKMADGAPMDPSGDNAASRTLPLGTTAVVTNVETGQKAVVKIQDRGPYVKGRIVDLSPSTAQKIGIHRSKGVAKVEVAPISVPLPDGSRKAGEGAKGAKGTASP